VRRNAPNARGIAFIAATSRLTLRQRVWPAERPVRHGSGYVWLQWNRRFSFALRCCAAQQKGRSCDRPSVACGTARNQQLPFFAWPGGQNPLPGPPWGRAAGPLSGT